MSRPGSRQLLQQVGAARHRNAAELSAAVVLGGGKLVSTFEVAASDAEGLLSPYCTPVLGQVGRCAVRCRLWPLELGFDMSSDDDSE
jgi:hypothetical protein